MTITRNSTIHRLSHILVSRRQAVLQPAVGLFKPHLGFFCMACGIAMRLDLDAVDVVHRIDMDDGRLLSNAAFPPHGIGRH